MISSDADGQGGRRTRRRSISLHGEQIGFWESLPAHDTGDTPRQDPDPQGPDRHGSGPAEVLVLVHGIAGSAHTWGPVLAELARRRDPRHVLVPDLVGHGSSSAPWADYSLGGYATGLRDLLAALGYQHATVVGHSLGGGVVQQFALQFPQHCDRLVLVSSGGLGREVSAVLRAATLPGAEWVLPVLTDRRVLGTATWLVHHLAGYLPGLDGLHGSLAESARSFTSLSDPTHRKAFLHTARSVIDSGGQRVRATDRLYLTEGLPTLIVWGDADAMIPVAHAHRAHTLITGSRLEILPGAGHFPHDDQPHRFTELLVDFLDHTTPGPRSTAEHTARIAAHAGLDTDTDHSAHHDRSSDGSALDAGARPNTESTTRAQRAEDVAEVHHRALTAHATVEQAVGILAYHGGTSPQEAHTALSDYADRHRFVPSELASDIVADRVDPATIMAPSTQQHPDHA